MLTATSTRTFSRSTLQTTIFLERRFRAHLVTRDRLCYDSRFAPPSKRASSFVHVYASLRGTMEVAGEPPTTGPQVYVLAETEFDRVGPMSKTFRSSGSPAVIIELRIPGADMRRPVGLANGPIDVPSAVWAAYQALEAKRTDEAVQALLVELATAGIVSRELADSVVREEPERFERLWTVLKPLYQDLATSASLKQIAALAKLSLRQLGRDLGELTRTFNLFGAGFRDATKILRLRAATLFLSAPDATPSDVARAVGYGSLDAMGRAFRDAALPAPSVVQDAVRYCV